jgi:excisionase family DNA binding protein
MREAKKYLGLHPNTIRKYVDEGRIDSVRTSGGQRRVDVESYVGRSRQQAVIAYCRVSSSKQKDDLARQVVWMREQFPDAELVTDVGSGLNFKRKGLRSLLDRLLRGDQLTIVVGHRDRLARFGFELIEYLVDANGGEILVLDKRESSPAEELTTDLLSILNVFSCRMHGLRRYRNAIKEDQSLSAGAAAN